MRRMHDFMMNPLVFVVYIIGTLSCLYHLTNGIFTFCITWGITVGPRAQTMVNRACVALFLAFSVMAMVTLLSFRRSRVGDINEEMPGTITSSSSAAASRV